MSKQKLPPVILLMGPTASGKTAAAIHLAQHFPCDVISVDSALIYRDMNIGTAKPTAEELALAPHALIDFLDPAESYSAAKFCLDAVDLIKQSHESGRIPLLVGGTMMYYKRLIDGISDLPNADLATRKQLEEQMASVGLAAMHQQLASVDPQSAERIHQNDPQRTLRALEIYQLTGKPMSALIANRQGALDNPQLRVALSPNDRAVLHKRIAIRFEQMVENGLIDEVEALYQRGDLTLDHPSMRSVGYRQVWQYLDGTISKDQMIKDGIVATRRLAKRQLTWLRSIDDVVWVNSSDEAAITNLEKLVKHFIA